MNRLLLIDDETEVQYSFGRIFASPDIQLAAASSGEEGLQLLPEFKPDLIILDIRLGGISGLETLRRLRQFDWKCPVIIMTAYAAAQTAIEAMKLGAYDYLLKPFDIARLKQVVQEALTASRDMRRVGNPEPLLASDEYSQDIVGRSEAMQRVFKVIGQAAATDVTVLITGESGTGKELIARAIFQHSHRNLQPFLTINCAAIPESLLESELFGHEKGAFSGALVQRIGKFEQCDRGTIFLDEIGDMSLATQTKILRVIQSGTFERVGGNEPIRVDVRIIAATNKPLEEAVAARQFREDLFYRLNVVRVQVPPLRQRVEDIPLLTRYFIQRFAPRQGHPAPIIADDVLQLFETYSWPGNVRQLENLVQRMLVMSKTGVVGLDDLPVEMLEASTRIPPASSEAGESPVATPPARQSSFAWVASLGRALFQWARQNKKPKVLPAVEKELIAQALLQTRGNQSQAARLLGITRAALRSRVEKFNLQGQVVSEASPGSATSPSAQDNQTQSPDSNAKPA